MSEPVSATALRRLIVMTRYPIPGKVKTRLIPDLGSAGAAELQRRMTERALAAARCAAAREAIEIEVSYTDAPERQVREWLGPSVRLREQRPGDLGQRIWQAVDAAFCDGAVAVVVVGADSPDLTDAQLSAAFATLGGNDLVLGPAEDGGYYLIGLARPLPDLFEGVPWSTERVLAETLRIADRLGLTPVLLEELVDIDRPEDLGRVPNELLDGLPPRS